MLKTYLGIFFLVILEENKINDADQCQNRGERSGLEELYKHIAAFDAAQREDPCGDGGTDVGTHDHVDGLPELHDAGVDKTDHHNRGGGGTLDDGGDAKAGEKAGDAAAGQLAQQGAKAVAGPALQSVTHDLHTEEEQTQAAQHSEYVKDIHTRK